MQARALRRGVRLALPACALALAACAGVGGSGFDILPSQSTDPLANVNLQGFPLPYRQGYADGCASVNGPERKDANRFRGDEPYRQGWQDGLSLCRKR